MTANGVFQLVLYVALLFLLARPLGSYMARIYEGKPPGFMRFLRPVENLIYRVARIRSDREMTWREYALSVVIFDMVGLVAVYGLQRLQHVLPLNPTHFGPVGALLSFNTAVSFATNTNWQAYGGETTMSYLVQMLGLTVQNFLSAASGMAVLMALIRGITRQQASSIGNFWQDNVRGTLYVLVPLSLIVSLILMSQGSVQTTAAYPQAGFVQAMQNPDTTQTIAVGPAASQIAIKQLGTNGGGFFNVNSAHPFENPTPLSNLVELLSILLIGAAFCFTFGRAVGDMRQGHAIFAAMLIIFVAFLAVAVGQEQAGNPVLNRMGLDTKASSLQPGGNMEGKEVRFGIVNSALWATATTAASNGSVNAMHDSFTPLGGLVPMVMMQLGEVVFGGVGSGFYGMLAFIFVTVFVAGLMVGRTPEYLGKKIEAHEMKMASLMILIPPILVLAATALSVSTGAGRGTVFNPGAHGFSEVLYAASSASNNNGSAFAGIGVATPFYCILLGLCMFFARVWLMIPALALAGSLAAKKRVPATAGTLPTHGPVFIALLIGIVLIVGALTFFPALALGPIVEHLQLHAGM